MRRFIKLSAIVLVYFIACGKSCNGPGEDNAKREMDQARRAKDSIASVFSSDSLSQESLRAFELTALYKLSDFSDYLQIIGDSSTGPAFRTKTGEMIRDLFLSENVRFRFAVPGCGEIKELSLEELLQTGLSVQPAGQKMVFDSASVLKKLQMDNDTTCSGRLAFCLRYGNPLLPGQKGNRCAGRSIDIFAVKCRKIFGSDTLRVWKVFLGDMR
ncbi:MAG: hypothetical protein WCK34_02375 [Bacteroidota bacterium]